MTINNCQTVGQHGGNASDDDDGHSDNADDAKMSTLCWRTGAIYMQTAGPQPASTDNSRNDGEGGGVNTNWASPVMPERGDQLIKYDYGHADTGSYICVCAQAMQREYHDTHTKMASAGTL